MSTLIQHKEQTGFATIAQNSKTVDYLSLAYVQAMSIKLVMPDSKYAVIVDKLTNSLVTDQHRKVFDYIIELPTDYASADDWKLANEWQIFYLTPFKETIKLESDLLITRDIQHWWHALRMREVVLSTGCKDYRGTQAKSRAYRKVFDDNGLPDIYNGMMYFRYSRTAINFFKTARIIYQNWPTVQKLLLKNCRDPQPTTDLVYALAAKIIGPENCTIPTLDFFNFVHMKPLINDWPSGNWQDMVITESPLPMIRIGNVNQYHPVHYHEKSYMTQELLSKYEQQFFK